MDPQSDIAALLRDIKAFRDAREWAPFHDPKSLAMSLSVEAAELLEVFLWKKPDEVNPDKLKDELADVFYCALLLADKQGLDVATLVRDKLAKNALKYPVDKARGSGRKYDEF